MFGQWENLVEIISPSLRQKHTCLKQLRRWSLQIQNADIFVAPISGDDDFFANLLITHKAPCATTWRAGGFSRISQWLALECRVQPSESNETPA